MYGNVALLQQTIAQAHHEDDGYERKLRLNAQRQFARLHLRAKLGAMLAHPDGRSYRLLALNGQANRGDGHHLGLRNVPIDQIRGSESRSHDFDRQFRPLKAHNRERWTSIAVARMMGAALPPVSLIQVGQVYYVRDGHHRISVARHLGQASIEAEVFGRE